MRMARFTYSMLLLLAMVLIVSPGCAKKKAPPPPVTQQPPVTHAPPETTVTKPPVREEKVFTAEDIHFDYDKSSIRDDAKTSLTELGKYLMENAAVRVQIEGHADERGTTDYNLALGERRAKAARDWLIAYGIGGDRISTISYGKERPLDPGHDESAWSKNRRDHFVLQGV